MSYLSSKQTPLTQVVEMVLSAPDMDWRRLVFEAACSKALHEWMVKALWLLPGTRGDISNISLTEKVDGILVSVIRRKSGFRREMLVDAIKIEGNPPYF